MRDRVSNDASPQQSILTRFDQIHGQREFFLYDRLHDDRAASPAPAPAGAETEPWAGTRAPAGPIPVIVPCVGNALPDISLKIDDDIGLLARHGLSEPLGRKL